MVSLSVLKGTERREEWNELMCKWSQGSLCLRRTKIKHLSPCFVHLFSRKLCNLYFRICSPFHLLVNNLFLHYAALFVVYLHKCFMK